MSGVVIFYVITTIVLAWCFVKIFNNFRLHKPKLVQESNFILYLLCLLDVSDLILGQVHQVLVHYFSRSDLEQCQSFGFFLNFSHNVHVLLALIYQYKFYKGIKDPTVKTLGSDLALFAILIVLTAVFNVNATAMICDNMGELSIREKPLA